MGCALYVFLFALFLAGTGYEELLQSRPYEVFGLAAGLLVTMLGLIMAWRKVCIAGWTVLAVIASMLLEVSSFILAEATAIALMVLGLGLPFLLLLEVILTVEGATIKARVIFRPRALAKASLLSAAVLLGLLFSFTYLPLLNEYASSPEAGTFQTAMMAGLATMVLASILLSQPKHGGKTR